MTDNYSFGDTLRKWEHISGMSGREVCRRSGIPYTTYQNYKSLRRAVCPSIENIKKIAKVFAISTDELLGVENADKSNAFEDQYRYNTEKFYKNLCSIINKALAGDEVTKGIMLRVCGVSDFLNNRRGKDSAEND